MSSGGQFVVSPDNVYIGLPHDVFAFTMVQELVARSVGVELGEYKHFVGSLHLYDTDREHAAEYLAEGWQSRVPMPPMPEGDPWTAVARVLRIEASLRNGRDLGLAGDNLEPYWADLIRIIQIFALTKKAGEAQRIRSVIAKMSSDVYAPYLRKRLERSTSMADQLEIFKKLPV